MSSCTFRGSGPFSTVIMIIASVMLDECGRGARLGVKLVLLQENHEVKRKSSERDWKPTGHGIQ